METPKFDRHKHMDSDTLGRIQDLITDLTITENCNANPIVNMFYGAFDGYDYSQQILQHELLTQLEDGGNRHLANDIVDLAYIIKTYPKL